MVGEMEKLICFPTERYDILSGQARKRFLLTLAAELNGIRHWKWKSELVIIFQMVILQQARLVTVTKNIQAKIDSRIDLWNSGAFD